VEEIPSPSLEGVLAIQFIAGSSHFLFEFGLVLHQKRLRQSPVTVQFDPTALL
jgi:hypothetical protein